MTAEINKAVGILTEMTEKSPGTLYMGIYSTHEANEAIRLVISELSRLREENERLKGEADEHALFDAETDIAFKDLDATIDDLKEQVATLSRERDEGREQVIAYRQGCAEVFDALCPACRGGAALPDKARDPAWLGLQSKEGGDHG